MKQVRTASVKLNISVEEILPTMQLYTKAFNLVCQVGFEKKTSNGITLHKLTYASIKESLALPSQLNISARMKASDTLESVFSKIKNKKKLSRCPRSKLCSIRLDKNSYTLFLQKKLVSILTINGRKKFILNIPKYFEEYFTWRNTSADLVIRKNKVYLKIVFERELPEIQPNGKFVGIDRGINNLAVTSNNKFYGGGKVKYVCERYRLLREALQEKGTKSAKRHLRKLSDRERRFKADVNHCIAKDIMSSLEDGTIIVLEDLSGIRSRRLRKAQRILINNWNFFQLELILRGLGESRGIYVKYIDPRYTSQRCSRCGYIHKSNRKSQSIFCCKKCGFKHNADLNAAKNICLKYLDSTGYPDTAAVNQPIVSA